MISVVYIINNVHCGLTLSQAIENPNLKHLSWSKNWSLKICPGSAFNNHTLDWTALKVFFFYIYIYSIVDLCIIACGQLLKTMLLTIFILFFFFWQMLINIFLRLKLVIWKMCICEGALGFKHWLISVVWENALVSMKKMAGAPHKCSFLHL